MPRQAGSCLSSQTLGVMRLHHFLCIAFALLATPLAQSQDAMCPADVVEAESSWRATCRCGKELNAIQLTLPTPFQLVAVCHLRSDIDQKKIPRLQSINLDKYDERDGWVNGTFYLNGQVRMPGWLRYETEGSLDGGELFFDPDHWPGIPETPLESNIRFLTVVPVGKLSTYKVDSSLLKAPCSRARATIAFSMLKVEVMYGTEGGGAYPLKANPVVIGPYQACPKE